MILSNTGTHNSPNLFIIKISHGGSGSSIPEPAPKKLKAPPSLLPRGVHQWKRGGRWHVPEWARKYYR